MQLGYPISHLHCTDVIYSQRTGERYKFAVSSGATKAGAAWRACLGLRLAHGRQQSRSPDDPAAILAALFSRSVSAGRTSPAMRGVVRKQASECLTDGADRLCAMLDFGQQHRALRGAKYHHAKFGGFLAGTPKRSRQTAIKPDIAVKCASTITRIDSDWPQASNAVVAIGQPDCHWTLASSARYVRILD